MIAVTIHHCISQPNIRIQNRQAKNRKREVDPALVAIKKQWCIGKVCDCGCGRPANTPHHPKGELYENDPAYADPANWEPYYHTCHHNLHKGLVRCPTCTGWMQPGNEKCYRCQGHHWKEAREHFIQNRKTRQKALRKAQADKAKAWKKVNGRGG